MQNKGGKQARWAQAPLTKSESACLCRADRLFVHAEGVRETMDKHHRAADCARKLTVLAAAILATISAVPAPALVGWCYEACGVERPPPPPSDHLHQCLGT